MPALGGQERRLTHFGEHPQWSPDGSEILAVSGAATSAPKLYAISSDGESTAEILSDFLHGGFWTWIAPHPDGRVSALGFHRERGPGFFAVSRDGGHVIASSHPRGFAPPPSEIPLDLVQRFQWHASGRWVYFDVVKDGARNLWRVTLDPKTLAWLSAERLTTSAGRDVGPTLSPDGRRLAFSTQHESVRLRAFPLPAMADGQMGQGKPLTEEGAQAGSAALSPDGEAVVYQIRRPGMVHDELWLTEIESGRSELVEMHSGGQATWSPDGKQIAYNRFRDGEYRPPFENLLAVRRLGEGAHVISSWMTNRYSFPPTGRPMAARFSAHT